MDELIDRRNKHEELNKQKKDLDLEIKQLTVIINSEKEKIAWVERQDMREIYKDAYVYYREFPCPICDCGKIVQLAELIRRKQDMRERYNTIVKDMARIRRYL